MIAISSGAAKPHGLSLVLGWRRLRFTLAFSLAIGLLFGLGWKSGLYSFVIRAVALGLSGMLMFGLFEQWPSALPRWLARWVLQVLAVAMIMPLTTWAIYALSTDPGAPPFWTDGDRLGGFAMLSILGLLLAPWTALAALVRQKDALARHQALRFELERSELEREALDARLRLLQAQVSPHFLFNTLANIQALVTTRSPRAAVVLDSLIAYLRAAVPRLNETTTTLGDELQLVRAYLDLMHMRIPDRLQFAIRADQSALTLHCPPMTLLTLVENAVRHGIDPSEDGGRIDIEIQRHDDRCTVRVADTGIGLNHSGQSLGTGLSTLRERLRLTFGSRAQLHLSAQSPRGVCATLDLPVQDPER